eukprot:9994756-Ditylum_brightwellii.AAC.1
MIDWDNLGQSLESQKLHTQAHRSGSSMRRQLCLVQYAVLTQKHDNIYFNANMQTLLRYIPWH